jgi:homoserine O-acetyltransferase/O-succinyltransferase
VGATPGRRFNGDQVAVLKTIKAKMIVLPALKDHCFPPEDEEFAVSHIPAAELRVIAGVYGHFAGGGAANSEDTAFTSTSSKAPRELTAVRTHHGPRQCRRQSR